MSGQDESLEIKIKNRVLNAMASVDEGAYTPQKELEAINATIDILQYYKEFEIELNNELISKQLVTYKEIFEGKK